MITFRRGKETEQRNTGLQPSFSNSDSFTLITGSEENRTYQESVHELGTSPGMHNQNQSFTHPEKKSIPENCVFDHHGLSPKSIFSLEKLC